jgi:flagellar FliL protein
MAQEETETPESADGEEGAAPKKGKKKLLFIIIGVLALAGIGAGVMLSGALGGGEKEKAKVEKTEEELAAEAAAAKPVYYELPEFLVNLSAGNQNRISFLKMSVTLELRNQAAVAELEANKPRVMDAFNTYLREMRPSDLAGSAGIYRLREELMTRLNGTIEEGLVKDILFSEILIQ